MTSTTSPSTGTTSSTVPLPVTVLLTPEEVAQALRVGRSKVYELMRSGALRSVKIGGSRRISATALAEFVASLEQSAA
jgi:excisionase family DNA binding protein